jgi:hypothetical protein
MWVIIRTSNDLQFCSSKKNGFIKDTSLQFDLDNGTARNYVKNHNFVVSKLISLGIPVFVYKKEAREHAVAEELMGFKYLSLSPTILSNEYGMS